MASTSSTHSTYPVHESNRGFIFTTDQGYKYILAFEQNLDEFPGESFRENCATIELVRASPKTENQPSKIDADPKIEATVTKLICDLFESNPFLVLNYSCDLQDNLERHRRIIFGKWYKTYFEPIGVLRINHENPSERMYATVLYHKDNPYRTDVELVFKEMFLGK